MPNKNEILSSKKIDTESPLKIHLGQSLIKGSGFDIILISLGGNIIMIITIGLTSVVCGVWKLVGVQRLEGSLFYIYVPPGSCESTRPALCTNF